VRLRQTPVAGLPTASEDQSLPDKDYGHSTDAEPLATDPSIETFACGLRRAERSSLRGGSRGVTLSTAFPACLTGKVAGNRGSPMFSRHAGARFPRLCIYYIVGIHSMLLIKSSYLFIQPAECRLRSQGGHW
jgi:hypothetical protein